MLPVPSVCQVAFSATDLERTHAWYREIFGFLPSGGTRRVCVRDPEGVLLELMEDDPRLPSTPLRARPEVPVAVRSVTLSVPDLDRHGRCPRPSSWDS